jgi:cyanuric acid amidohydrolase
VSALRALLADEVDARDVIAVIGKSEGTGLGRDQGRETADAAIRDVFARSLGIEPEAVADRICIVLSGGTPGVLTPHVAVVSRRWVPDGPTSGEDQGGQRPSGENHKRLVVGAAHSRDILPEDVGRMAHIRTVADAVRQAMDDAGVSDPGDVHLVLVKAPSLTPEGIAAARERGHDTVTSDLGIGPEGAICFSNDASALGVAAALGEVDEAALDDDVVRGDWSLYSEVAMTSSGGEKTHAEVLLLANAERAAGSLRIGHRPMTDILDQTAVDGALTNAGLPGSSPSATSADQIVYLLAKMIIPGSARLRGGRITLQDDPQGYHVAKAMGGYLLAATTGHTMCFVSGGERNSHQGPPEGNPLAAIVRLP